MRWILLAYKAPQQPSTARAAAWRLLKGAGALYVQQSVCLLPDLVRTREVVTRVQAFVEQAEGEAFLLDVSGMSAASESDVRERFNALREAEYAELLERCDGFLEELRRESGVGKFTFAEVEENEDDLVKLRAWLRKIRTRDFFGCARGAEAEAAIRKCVVQLDAFTERVLAHEGAVSTKERIRLRR
ncbi:MAG TPA: Chromate resistance protein ChrB [Candidatus Limnocylindria bacterium]|nr:Chromate resistance protein ChrB [Candidatus Limnocylindria bacterium]